MSLPKSFPIRAANDKTIQIPSVGYGTWASGENSWAKDAVVNALKAGYRHLDCAWMYGVDELVGEAIRESGIPREEIFVTTKFWPHFGHPDDVELCLDKILKNMQLDYVDLYLAHWPIVTKSKSREALEKARAGHDATTDDMGFETADGKPVVDWAHSSANMGKRKGKEGSFVPTWKAMQECVRHGKAKMVGVSNFSISDIEDLLPHQGDVPISCNQVEVHPFLPQNELLEFGKKHGILITCYSPFAGQKTEGATLMKDQTVNDMAKRNGMDIGQLLQSWAVQRGTVPLGKSGTPSRIKSNLDVQRLSDEDMKTLAGIAPPDGKGRSVNFSDAWGVPLFQG